MLDTKSKEIAMKLIARVIAVVAAATFVGTAAFAAPTATASTATKHSLLSLLHKPKPAKPAHHGMLGFLHKPKPTTMTHHSMMHHPMAGTQGGGMFAGKIIGNKNTHVYHVAGDPGALPAPQNRVYFHTEAQALAAGYRRAGGGKGGKHSMGSMKTHHMSTMMHH
jgi:hypothetical protein